MNVSAVFLQIQINVENFPSHITSIEDIAALFKAMMQVIDALSTCVRHVGTFEDAPDLEAIRSLPTCILKILKETFQHCKVGLI